MSKRRKNKQRKSTSGTWCKPNYANSVHHRLPKSRGGANSPENYSTVPVHLHQAYNALFGGNPTAEEVVKILTDIWIDPCYVIVAVKRADCGLVNVSGDGTYQTSD